MGTMMNISASSLLWGLLFSSIGMGYFLYGKTKGQIVTLLSGIALMVFTYFISSSILIAIIGVALMAVPYFFKY